MTASPVRAGMARFTRWAPDVLLLSVASVVLFVFCVHASAAKYMWNDEIQTWFLVTDPSISHVMTALAAGADSAPPTYHVLAHWWTLLVGATPLSLRLFSCLGVVAAMAIFWVVLRRAFSWRATALATLTIFCTAQPIIRQATEVRYYGLLLFLYSLALLLAVLMVERTRPSLALLIGNTIVQALLVTTHLFGGIYSSMLLFGIVVYDLATKRTLRWGVYGSFVAGWLAFLPYVPIFLGQRASAPRSWMRMPGPVALLEAYGFGIYFLPITLLAAVAWPRLVPMVGFGPPALTEPTQPNAYARRHATLLFGATALVVPLIAFVVSHAVTIVFHERYFIPASLGMGICIAWIVDTGERTAFLERMAKSMPAITPTRRLIALATNTMVIVGALGVPLIFPTIWLDSRPPVVERPGATVERLATGNLANIPVVAEFQHDFLQLTYYTPAQHPVRYTYVIDSAFALSHDVEPSASIAYFAMRAYRRLGYPPGPFVVDRAPFLAANHRFLVLDSPVATWFDRQIKGNPAFTSTRIGHAQQYDIWLVEQRP